MSETETGSPRGPHPIFDRRLGTALELGLAVAAFLYFVNIEGYPVLLASLAGAAVALLVFSGRRTLANLLVLHDRGYEVERDPPSEAAQHSEREGTEQAGEGVEIGAEDTAEVLETGTKEE